METPSRKELYKALFQFQAKCPRITKDTQAHNYSYTPLETILNAIRPLLTKCGLLILPVIEGDMVRTQIIHAETGQSVESYVPISQFMGQNSKMTLVQQFGSATTYTRRYSINIMLGIAPEDDDGASTSSSSVKTINNEAFGQSLTAAFEAGESLEAFHTRAKSK